VAEYGLQFVASAAKEFRSLPASIKGRVGRAVEALRKNPRPDGARKLIGHERFFRIRVGQYRIVYEIDDQAKLIRVTRVRHRREAYR
jgi:mRNA interferase RelE/StbE